jgi:chromosomal replication initiation ATPase DnaA
MNKKIVIELNTLDAMIITGLLDAVRNNFREMPPIIQAIERFVDTTCASITIDQINEAEKELLENFGICRFKVGRN